MLFRGLVFIVAISLCHLGNGQGIYRGNDASINFQSTAALEIFDATSDRCQGVVDVENGTFVFKVLIKSFEGFNNALQRTHFLENYMEINNYPEATFTGNIIEEISGNDPAKLFYVRAKGLMDIHGVQQEIIVPLAISFKDGNFNFATSFKILLKDFNINIPRIVTQKIASTIQVKVEGVFHKSE